MYFDTKKWILEYLGKKGKNVRWLERLIKLGVVLEKDWRYITRNDAERAAVLKVKDRVKELEEENSRLQKVAEWGINASYYEDLYNKECEEKESIIKRCYEFMTKRWMKINWDEYNAWVNWELD